MAAHRYWALLLMARPGSGNGVSLAEVQMRATAGGANQCVGGTASGAATSGTSAAGAFDGNTGTHWYNGAVGLQTRLSYDFGVAVTVAEVVVTTSGAGLTPDRPGATYGPAACWVQWSDDGTAWFYANPARQLGVLGDAESATIGPTFDTGVGPGGRTAGHVARLSPGGLGTARWRAPGRTLRYDPVDGGPLRVAGDVGIKAEDGGTGALITGVDGNQIQPLRRRVRLLQRLTARLVREAWSNATTGAYAFAGLKDQDYLVVVDDYARVYNAVAADAVRPTP